MKHPIGIGGLSTFGGIASAKPTIFPLAGTTDLAKEEVGRTEVAGSFVLKRIASGAGVSPVGSRDRSSKQETMAEVEFSLKWFWRGSPVCLGIAGPR